jgi:hypothetical protein
MENVFHKNNHPIFSKYVERYIPIGVTSTETTFDGNTLKYEVLSIDRENHCQKVVCRFNGENCYNLIMKV